jgi:hypothetical protein
MKVEWAGSYSQLYHLMGEMRWWTWEHESLVNIGNAVALLLLLAEDDRAVVIDSVE